MISNVQIVWKSLSNDEHVYFGTLPVTVRRNAYGRQLGSFHTDAEAKGIGEVPMTFIRAPYIETADEINLQDRINNFPNCRNNTCIIT